MKPKRDRREYMRAWRAANQGQRREYNLAWRQANPSRKCEYGRAWYARNADQIALTDHERRQRNLPKGRARGAIGDLKKAGQISAPWVCENCHTVEQLDGHHDDYQYPLQIRWLCRRCHQRWHAEHGEAPNGATPWTYHLERKYRIRAPALKRLRKQIEQKLSNLLTEIA